MRTTMKGLTALAAIMLLTACNDNSTQQASARTHVQYEQLSQLDWAEMTAAPTAATVTNNNLIMMR